MHERISIIWDLYYVAVLSNFSWQINSCFENVDAQSLALILQLQRIAHNYPTLLQIQCDFGQEHIQSYS